jgi:hypothetical protein
MSDFAVFDKIMYCRRNSEYPLFADYLVSRQYAASLCLYTDVLLMARSLHRYLFRPRQCSNSNSSVSSPSSTSFRSRAPLAILEGNSPQPRTANIIRITPQTIRSPHHCQYFRRIKRGYVLCVRSFLHHRDQRRYVTPC